MYIKLIKVHKRRKESERKGEKCRVMRWVVVITKYFLEAWGRGRGHCSHIVSYCLFGHVVYHAQVDDMCHKALDF